MMPKFLRVTLYFLVGLVGLYFVATPFAVPWFAERTAQEVFAEKVSGTLVFEDMSFNPFTLRTEITGLAVDDSAGAPVLRLPMLVLDAAWSSALGGDIFVDEVRLSRTQINMALFENGSTSIARMLKPSAPTESESQKTAPIINIGILAIEDAGIALTNENGREVAVGPVNITLKDVSTAPEKIANLNQFVVELGGGRVSLAGSMQPDPLELDVKLDFENLPIDGIAGLYLKDSLTIDSGFLGGTASIAFGQTSSLSGSLNIDQLSVKTPTAARAVKVPSGQINEFATGLAFKNISVGSISLTDPEIAVVNDPPSEQSAAANGGEGVEIAAPETAASEAPATDVAEPSLNVSVGQFKLLNGTISVTDNAAGAAPITFDQTNITIDDFAYGDGLKANFDIAAQVANESPLKLAGNFNSADKLTAKVDVTLDKLGYSVIAPYSASAVGRDVDEGSFYLDLKYSITENALEAENILLFDRWKWGRSIEGFDGASVPVDLAFALLQDSNGRVELDVPVRGNLDDPEFRFGRVVFRAFTNVIVKLVASPFKLLGALIPGGNSDLDLSKVKFIPSVAEIEPIEKAKLDALAKALAERPALKLEIVGVAAANRDMQPVQEAAIQTDPDSGEPLPAPEPMPLDADGLTALANARAELVYQMLLDSGVAADRLVVNAPSIDKPARGRSVSVILDLIK